jgi:hypothetical protein
MSIDIFANPVMPRIGDAYITQSGLNLYSFKEQKGWQKEIGVRLLLPVKSRLFIGVAIGVKHINYEFETYITSPLIPTDIAKVVGGKMDLLAGAPSISLEYCFLNHLSLLLGLEVNIPINVSSSFEVIPGHGIIEFDPDNNKLGSLFIRSPASFERTWEKFVLPEIRLSYAFLANLSLDIGVKFKPYGNRYLYGLQVEGFTGDMPVNVVEDLQVTTVYNKVIMPYLGLHYRLQSIN